MKRMYGVVIPMVTPLTEDDHVDVLSLQRLTDFLIDKGVDCLYPCGTTGEMAYLTDDERILVVETVVRQAAGRVPVFAQVGAANTSSTIRLAQHAAACGADGVGVVTPWYFQLSDDALLSYYKEVSDSVPADFPIYMYGIPQNAVNDITPALAERVAQACPNVVGVKYSYPDMTRLQQLMTVRNGAFDVLVGPDHLYEAVVAVGGKGVLQGGLGGFRQVVGCHHGHVIVCMDGKEILPDEVVAEEHHDDADDDDPLEVIIPPVGPAFLAGVLALFAGLEVFGVDIAFVTVACHGAVPSKF